MTHTVQEVMTQDLKIAHVNWTLDELVDYFVDNQISGAPVMSAEDNLVGVVSMTDIIRHQQMKGVNQISDNHAYYTNELSHCYSQDEIQQFEIEDSSIFVKDIMTPMVFRVDERTSLQEVADSMIKGHLHRVFVTRDDKVIGIVTALDMLKFIRDL